MYVILLTPRRVASFIERFSPFTHTTLLSVPPLSTIVNRFRFDSRDRSYSRASPGIGIGRTAYSRGSHALYLELRQCPALPVRFRLRGIERVTAFEPTALLAERVQNISMYTVYTVVLGIGST